MNLSIKAYKLKILKTYIKICFMGNLIKLFKFLVDIKKTTKLYLCFNY